MMSNFSGQSSQSESNIPITLDEWNHWAICKSGNRVYFYKDGICQPPTGGSPATVAWPDYGVPLRIGYQQDVEYYNGYADEIRISKGIARYPAGANFTVPTSAYTADEYDVLLLHCDGSDSGTTFTDSSYAGNVPLSNYLTVNGHAKNERVKSNLVSAGDSAEALRPYIIGPKIGSSAIKFDGDEDSLSLPDSNDWDFAAGSYTVDFWANTRTPWEDDSFFWTQWEDSNNFAGMRIRSNGHVILLERKSGSYLVNLDFTAVAMPKNQWFHLSLIHI